MKLNVKIKSFALAGFFTLHFLFQASALAQPRQCALAFSETSVPNDLSDVLNGINLDQAHLSRLMRLNNQEVFRDKLRKFNGNNKASYQIKRKRVFEELKTNLKTGDLGSALNLMRPYFRQTELAYVEVRFLTEQNQQLLNVPTKNLNEADSRNSLVLKNEQRIEELTADLGRSLGDYLLFRGYLEDVAKNILSDPQGLKMDVAESLIVEKTAKDKYSLAEKTAALVATKLGVDKLQAPFPELSGYLAKPTLAEIRKFVNSSPTAMEAMIKYHEREELMSTFKYAVRSIFIKLSDFVAAYLPEEIQIPKIGKLPIRRFLLTAIVLSRDQFLRDTYVEKVLEVHEKKISTKNRFLLLRNKSAGPYQPEFLETYARIPEAKSSWESLKKLAEKEEPWLYQKMLAADERHHSAGDLPPQSPVSPRDRVAIFAAAIASGSAVVLTKTDWGIALLDYLHSWIPTFLMFSGGQ